MATANMNRGTVLSGTLWMVGLAILLFWLPVAGPLIAGFVGGRKSGSVGSALVASIIPAVLAAGLFLLVGSGMGFPLLSALAGAGIFIIILIETVPMMVAALVGGVMAERTAPEG